MRRLLILSGLMTLLIGCAGTSSKPIYLTRCPALVAYPPALQDKAAEELSLLPPDAATIAMVADYATLRAKCRAQ